MYNGRITLVLRSDEHPVNVVWRATIWSCIGLSGKVCEGSAAHHSRDSDQRALGTVPLASSRSFIWHWPRELCVAIDEWHGVGPRIRLSQEPGDSYTSGSAPFLATGVTRRKANPTRPNHSHNKKRLEMRSPALCCHRIACRRFRVLPASPPLAHLPSS